MTDPKLYQVEYDNGAHVTVTAHNEADARAIALEQAALDGYGGLSVSHVDEDHDI